MRELKRNRRVLEDLARRLEELDRDGRGEVPEKDFLDACLDLDVQGTRNLKLADIRALVEDYELEGRRVGSVKYGNFLEEVGGPDYRPKRGSSRGGDDDYDDDGDAKRSVSKILERINDRDVDRKAFSRLDRKRDGRLNKRDFIDALEDMPRLKLRKDDVDDLSRFYRGDYEAFLEDAKDGRVGRRSGRRESSRSRSRNRSRSRRRDGYDDDRDADADYGLDVSDDDDDRRGRRNKRRRSSGRGRGGDADYGVDDDSDRESDRRDDDDDDDDDKANLLRRTLTKAVDRGKIRSYRSFFEKMDDNNSGQASRKEFGRALREKLKLDLTRAQEGRLMKLFDRDGDGKIDHKEFLDFCEEKGRFARRRGGGRRDSDDDRDRDGRMPRRRDVEAALKVIGKEMRRQDDDSRGGGRHGDTLLRAFEDADRSGRGTLREADFERALDAWRPSRELESDERKAILAWYGRDGDYGALVEEAEKAGGGGGGGRRRRRRRDDDDDNDYDDYDDYDDDRGARRGGDLEQARRVFRRRHGRGGDRTVADACRDLCEEEDREGRGVLRARDFERILSRDLDLDDSDLSKREIRGLARRFDKLGDGRVDYEAFLDKVSGRGGGAAGGRGESAGDRQRKVEATLAKLRAFLQRAAETRSGRLDYRSVFEELDENDSGEVSKREFREVLEDMGLELTAEEVRQILRRFDRDKNGMLDYREFVAVCVPSPEENYRTELAKAVRKKIRRAAAIKSSRSGKPALDLDAAFSSLVNGDDEERRLFKKGRGTVSRRALEKLAVRSGWDLSKEEMRVITKGFASRRGGGGGGGGRIDYPSLKRFLALDEMDLMAVQERLRRYLHDQAARGVDFLASFEWFDRDQSGHITLSEFQEALAKLGFRLTKDEASDLLSNVDSNYDGEINYKEFVAAFAGGGLGHGGGGLGGLAGEQTFEVPVRIPHGEFMADARKGPMVHRGTCSPRNLHLVLVEGSFVAAAWSLLLLAGLDNPAPISLARSLNRSLDI